MNSINFIILISLQNKLQSNILKRGYDSPMMLRNTTIYGVLTAPSAVFLRGLKQKFSYNAELQVGYFNPGHSCLKIHVLSGGHHVVNPSPVNI